MLAHLPNVTQGFGGSRARSIKHCGSLFQNVHRAQATVPDNPDTPETTPPVQLLHGGRAGGQRSAYRSHSLTTGHAAMQAAMAATTVNTTMIR